MELDSGDLVTAVDTTFNIADSNPEGARKTTFVELMREVESTFEIAISDQESSGIITVGNLFESVIKRLEQKALSVAEPQQSDACLRGEAYDRLCRALVDSFGVSRVSIRSSSRVELFLPVANRRREWACLSRALGLRLPRLRRPGWMIALIMTTSLVSLLTSFASLFVTVFFRGSGFFDSPLAFIVNALAVACFLVSLVAFFLTRPYQRSFPADCQTVEDLSAAVVRMNVGKLAKARAAINRDEAWRVLRAILVIQLRLKPEEVTTVASFAKDFGMCWPADQAAIIASAG